MKRFTSCLFLHKHFFFILVIFVEFVLLIDQCSPTYTLLPLPLLLLYVLLVQLRFSRPRPVYLVDYSCLRPPASCRFPASLFMEHVILLNIFNKDSISFMAKALSTSGQSDQTYLPPPLHYLPPKCRHQDAIEEAHMLLFPVMDDLLLRTKLSPDDIDVLVVTSSGFCTSPSLTSIIVNKYNLRDDIKTFNITGMGCSSGAIGIDVARNLLQSCNISHAVVVTTEILTPGWYSGNDKRKLSLNCRFRMGASAALLTNKTLAMKTAKYKILHVVRTQIASNDSAYHSASLEEDSQGIRGFSLEPDVLKHFSNLLRANFTVLGRSILPLSEKVKHLLVTVVKAVYNPKRGVYVPRFGTVVKHYCIPPSSMSIVNEIGRRLGLKEEEMEPAKVTINRFGNQSSSGMWYQMAYMEAKRTVRKGDNVWQIWVGSGLKCSSVVLQCLRNLDNEARNGPWHDCSTLT